MGAQVFLLKSNNLDEWMRRKTLCKILSQVPAWLPNASKQPHLEMGYHCKFNDVFPRWQGDFQTINTNKTFSKKKLMDVYNLQAFKLHVFYHDCLTKPLHCQTTRCLLNTYEPKTATEVKFEVTSCILNMNTEDINSKLCFF